MIVKMSGVLVDSKEGVVTPEKIRRWVSSPTLCHKGKECITAFDDDYLEMERLIGNYVIAHALAKDKSIFSLSPVGLSGSFYPHNLACMWFVPGERLLVQSPPSGGYLVAPLKENKQCDWDRALPFHKGFVARVMCPPGLEGVLDFWAEDESRCFEKALAEMECSFHSHYATWLMLASCFPNSTLAEWCGVGFRSFGWDTSLCSKPVHITPVEDKIQEMVSVNARFRVLYEARLTG